MVKTKKLIMVVDDEPHMIELEKAILEAEGYKIVTALDGQEALEKLDSIKPDLIILDMMMPGMSGREVCEVLRKNSSTKKVKVVFVTVAQFSEIGKNKLKDMNVSDYINKPFDNEEYVARIKKAIGD